jgi:uncharacterized membrane-anchored protein YitT (DUF2179 family)
MSGKIRRNPPYRFLYFYFTILLSNADLYMFLVTGLEKIFASLTNIHHGWLLTKTNIMIYIHHSYYFTRQKREIRHLIVVNLSSED